MPGAAFAPTRLADLWTDVSLSGVAQGDLLVRGATHWNNFSPGTNGYFLKSNGPGASPSWASAVTSPGGSSGQLQYNNSGVFGGLASTAVATSGNLITVTAPAATDVPLTIDGHVSQTANLLTLKTGSTTVAKVSPAGVLTLTGSGTASGLSSLLATTNTYLVMRGNGQTSSGAYVSIGRDFTEICSTNIGGTNQSTTLTTTAAGTVVCKLQLAAAHTADALQVTQNDGTTVLTNVTKDGYVYSRKSDATQYSGLRGTGSSPSYPGLHCYHDSGNGYFTFGYGTWEAYIGTTAYLSLSSTLLSNFTVGTRLGSDANVTAHEIYRRTSYANSATGAGLRIYTDDGPTGATNSDSGNLTLHVGNKRGSGNYGVIRLGYTGSAARGNISLFGAGSFGGGENVLYLATATTAPTSNPTGGFVFYVDPGDGAYKCRGPSGTITTLGVP